MGIERKSIPRASDLRRLATCVAASITIASVAFTIGAPGTARAGSDDYPTSGNYGQGGESCDLRDSPQDSIIDVWGFFNRECTSFAAWRMERDGHPMSNSMRGGSFGDASHWYVNAIAIGIPTTTTPVVGAVMQSATVGHVAYTETPATSSTVEDYNWAYDGTYREHGWGPSDQEFLIFGPPMGQSNLLSNASFEAGQGVAHWSASSGVGYQAWQDTSFSKEGPWYLDMVTTSANGSVYQDISAQPGLGQSYTASVWLRSNDGSTLTGSVTLFGLGGTQEYGTTYFSIAGSSWTLISAPLYVKQSGHASLRFQVYLTTVNKHLDLDGGTMASGNESA